MRSLAVRAAILAGVVILAVEGYLLYSFYTEPAANRGPTPAERAPESATGRNDGTQDAGQAGDAGDTDDAGRAEEDGREGRGEPRQGSLSVAGYAEEVGELQAEAVADLDDSGEKLARYDTLTAEDVEVMEENRATIGRVALRARGLDAPEGYADHRELFVSAAETMREAAEVAHRLAADPVAATRSGFEEHRRLVGEADALLRRSNEEIGRDHETPVTTKKEGL